MNQQCFRLNQRHTGGFEGLRINISDICKEYVLWRVRLMVVAFCGIRFFAIGRKSATNKNMIVRHAVNNTLQ